MSRQVIKSFEELKENIDVDQLSPSTTPTNTTTDNYNTNSIPSIEEYYLTKYGKPRDSNHAIEILHDLYREFIARSKVITMEEKDGIAEYYRILQERQLPAFEWMLEVVHIVSKKESGKRNFPYTVGVLRQWMKHGFGYIPNREEEELIEYFEEVIQSDISDRARTTVRKLMGEFGVVKVTRMVSQLHTEIEDRSTLMSIFLEKLLNEKYKE